MLTRISDTSVAVVRRSSVHRPKGVVKSSRMRPWQGVVVGVVLLSSISGRAVASAGPEPDGASTRPLARTTMNRTVQTHDPDAPPAAVPLLRWTGPKDCPSEAAFEARVIEYLGREVPPTASLSAGSVEVTRGASGYRVTM